MACRFRIIGKSCDVCVANQELVETYGDVLFESAMERLEQDLPLQSSINKRYNVTIAFNSKGIA